jgi:hypothetical protein
LQTYASVFERELAKLMQQAIEKHKEELSSGLSIQTIESYREKVGKLAGLREALELFDEANDIVSKRERGL